MAKQRNQFVDLIRGGAMLLVVLGHTMTGFTKGSQTSFLFNIVWSLQMPLFILISGYVTRYSREIGSASDLCRYIRHKTVAYMFPWLVWSLLIRGVLFGQKTYLNISYLLWHMDSGYWFLATIWTINIFYGVASYLSFKFKQESTLKKQIVFLFTYIVGMVLLVAIGTITGFSFFAIKLTLYYMPFFYAGFLFGQYDKVLLSKKKVIEVIDCVVAVCFAMWLFIILRQSLYEMSDGVNDIIVRAITSLMGCIAVCGLFRGLFSDVVDHDENEKNKDQFTCQLIKAWLTKVLCWAGTRSLEIYLVHYLILGQLTGISFSNSFGNAVDFNSVEGYLLTGVIFIFTVSLCAAVIGILNQNTFLKKVLCIR